MIRAFTEYEDTLIIRTKLNKDISQASGAQKAELINKVPTSDQKLAADSKELDNALEKVKKYYPNEILLKNRIDQFEIWKKQSEAKIAASADTREWLLTYIDKMTGIKKALEEIVVSSKDSMHKFGNHGNSGRANKINSI